MRTLHLKLLRLLRRIDAARPWLGLLVAVLLYLAGYQTMTGIDT